MISRESEEEECTALTNELQELFESKKLQPTIICSALLRLLMQITLRYAIQPELVISVYLEKLNTLLALISAGEKKGGIPN